MRHPTAFLPCVLFGALIVGWGSPLCRAAQLPEPLSYIHDVSQAPADVVADPWLAKLDGRSRLAEDDKSHVFRGLPVLMNDKILAVLEADGAGMAVFSRQTRGTKLCARLQPICGGRADAKRQSIAIKENTPGTVSLEVAVASPAGAPRRITYELNAGEPFIKVTGSAGVEKLRVGAPCRFAVLPDFFGDDIVIDAAAIPVSQAELPSENFLLHMMHGGEAIVMTVSESRDNDIVARLSAGSTRELLASDISFGAKPRIWVAVLADQGIWHERAIGPADAGKVLRLDWQMPFAALWRVDWSKTDKLAESWEMLLQEPGGKYVMQNWFGQKESEGQSFGEEFGPRDWNKPNRQRWNPVLGAFKFPCWIDNDRTGHLQPLERPRNRKEGEVPTFVGPAIIYPIDRAKTPPFSTPLEKLTVVDLVRMTLGIGPCQYILDLEGQKRNSRGVATCYARDVINAIYKEGSQLRQGSVIDEQLNLCVAFIGNVRERIDQYVRFGHEMTAYLVQQKQLRPGNAEFLDEMISVSRKLDAMFEQNREKIRTPAFAQQTADAFRASLLKYAEKDAHEKCAAQMAVFTSIGGAQDELVANCRMIVKTLRQRAGIAVAANPALKEVAAEVRQRTQTMLRNATAYEAPRH